MARRMTVTGIEIFAKTTACAHSCRYCLIGKKTLTDIELSRFFGLVERFITWRESHAPGLEIASGIDHSFEFDVFTLKRHFDLLKRIGWPAETCGIRLGGLRLRSDAELRTWLRERRDIAGLHSVHASLAGYGEVHDRWNGRKGDFEFLFRIMAIAAELGLRLAQRLFLVRSTLPLLDGLVDRLETIPGGAERYLCTFFYRGLADRLEAERITEDIRDRLPARLDALGRRDAAEWYSEREWIEIMPHRVPSSEPVRLRLEITEGNIGRLEAMSCDAIVAELSARTGRAYARLPATMELCDDWSDAGNRRIYAGAGDMERLWLDRYLARNPLTFERSITHLAMAH